MIDLLGFVYDVMKDIKEYLEYEETEKVVDGDWLATSGLQAMAEADGLTLRWSHRKRIPARELDGYEMVYEINRRKRIRSTLVLDDGSILIGKRRHS